MAGAGRRGELGSPIDDAMAAIMAETRKRVESIYGRPKPQRGPDYGDDDFRFTEDEFGDDDDAQVARELGITPTPSESTVSSAAPRRSQPARKVQASVRPPGQGETPRTRVARLRERRQNLQFKYDGASLTIVKAGRPVLRLGEEDVDRLLEALGG